MLDTKGASAVAVTLAAAVVVHVAVAVAVAVVVAEAMAMAADHTLRFLLKVWPLGCPRHCGLHSQLHLCSHDLRQMGLLT